MPVTPYLMFNGRCEEALNFYKKALGAEVGISTQKMHARGPMGLRELTSYKWTIMGRGQVRPL